MTGKERILAALAGEKPDRVPFVPNIWQWFEVNESNGTLPQEVRDCRNPVEVLRAMGADVFSKFDAGRPVPTYHTCNHTVTFAGEPTTGKPLSVSFASFEGGTIRREEIETPFGSLTHVWEYRPETGAPFESEHWWKDFDGEYTAVRHWLADTDWECDRQVLREGLERIRNDGTPIFQLLPSALKQFHWLAGQVNASLFIADHPREMRELAAIHERKSLEHLEKVVDLDDVWVLEVADNVDSLFYSPALFQEFCLPTHPEKAG